MVLSLIMFLPEQPEQREFWWQQLRGQWGRCMRFLEQLAEH